MRIGLSLLVVMCAASAAAQDAWTRDQGGLFETDSAGVPSPFGWPLAPNADGVWTSVRLNDGPDGVRSLDLSTLFVNGLALGETAANHPYRGLNSPVFDGPRLNIHLSGVVSLGAPLAPARQDEDSPRPGLPGMSEGVGLFKSQALQDMGAAVPELLAPRWSEAQDYVVDPDTNAASKPCGMEADQHQVYVWSNQWDQARIVERPMFVITWQRILPRDTDCDAETNTFQALIIEEPGRALDPSSGQAGEGRNLATVQYRYGSCGWSAPKVSPINLSDAVGARSGFLVRGSVGEGANQMNVQQGVEVLGRAGVLDNGEPADDPQDSDPASEGLSGDPIRQQAYCMRSNLADPQAGVFEFAFGGDGLPAADADEDGVSDTVDNCPGAYNPLQHNLDQLLAADDPSVDGDTAGDACDTDVDGDDWDNADDNCPRRPNPGQSDLDRDSEGDICDNDIDGDGWPNDKDNCVETANRYQWDGDNDGKGALCDKDHVPPAGAPEDYVADPRDTPLIEIILSIKLDAFNWAAWFTLTKNEIKSDSRFLEVVYALNKEFKVDQDIAGWFLQDMIISWLQESKADFHEYLKWRLEKITSAKVKQ